ncbi:MAG TPA: CpaF family protein [Actinomycetota bacterium]
MSLQERLTRARAKAASVETTEPAPPPAPANANGNANGNGKAPRPVEREFPVDPFSDLKRRIHGQLVATLGPKFYDVKMKPEELEAKVRKTLQKVLDGEDSPLSPADRARIITETTDDILGFGPLEPLLSDPEITEVLVNGPYTVFAERHGKLTLTNARFQDEAQLRHTIDKIVGRIGRRVDEASPYVDARLPDGSRVNATIPPISIDGATLSIRKFSKDPYTAEHLVGFGTVTQSVAEFLEACVRGKVTILVSGGTGAGKTTTLNVLSSFIPADERIITIEDAAELRLQQPHVVRLESRPPNIEARGEITIRDLVRNSLRMRPDRIVVGEVRGGEAMDMLQAMNTGHEGSISTVHANTPRDALSRIETMCLMAGMDLPVRAIREQTSSAIALIVHQSRLKDGTRRVTHVTEVTGMEGEVITLQDLFLFDYAAGVDDNGRFLGTLVATGLRAGFWERLADEGIRMDPAWFEKRTTVRGGRR